jgi:hypothetical protein
MIYISSQSQINFYPLRLPQLVNGGVLTVSPQRAGPQTLTRSAPSSKTEPLPITYPGLHSSEVGALNNEDEETTQMTWPETADENEPSLEASTPPPERRSRRRRKTSYTDILAQSTSNTMAD